MPLRVTSDRTRDLEPVHHVHALDQEGIDRVEINVRFDRRTGPSRMLKMLARATLEVLLASRDVEGLHAPAKPEPEYLPFEVPCSGDHTWLLSGRCPRCKAVV